MRTLTNVTKSFSDAVKRERAEGIEFNSIEYLGLVAGSFAVFAGVAQVVTLIKRRTADDISYLFLLGAAISTALWVTYHFLKRGGGPLITTTLTLIGLLMVLALKIVFDVHNKGDTLKDVRIKEKKGYLYYKANKLDKKEKDEEDADLTILSSQG